MRTYYVYIMANQARSIYTGVTNDLARRVREHKNHLVPGYTSKYGLTDLVYNESAEYVLDAIAREKQIKGWVRRKKVSLIETLNPNWDDLSAVVVGPEAILTGNPARVRRNDANPW